MRNRRQAHSGEGLNLDSLMDALTNDNSGYFQINIPNNGLIAGIPDDVVVEVPGFVSKSGIQGMQIGRLPDNVMLQIILPRIVQAERRIGLARSPNRGLLLNMILYDHVNLSNRYTPPSASFEEAEERMARILERDPELAELVNG